jgi:hypothetical protein
MKLSHKVYQIIEDYKKDDLKICEGWYFNAYETIRRINLYVNNKYLNREDNPIFWNISNARIIHFAKNMDFDTKDLVPYGIGEYNYVQAWILKNRFRKWLDDEEFYEILNNLSEGLATYGSWIWKFYPEDGKRSICSVDLRNIYFKQNVKCLEDADIVELHYLSERELREKDGVWKNIKEVIKKATGKDAEIWEYTGDYAENEDDNPEYIHAFGYGQGDNEVILFQEPWSEKKFQYFDFHLGDYRGRWLRIGVVERLFDLQVRANELVNQNAQTTAIASMLLFRSAKGDVLGNVLENAINGQIIPSEDLEQIGITNTGLSQFASEMAMIENQADKLCLTPEIITGENAPSGTPFRSVAVTANNAKSAFRFLKETIGEKIGYVLKEQILKYEAKKWSNDGLIEIASGDEDVKMYDEAVKKFIARKAKIETILSGKVVTPEMGEAMDMMASETVENEMPKMARRVEIPKDFFNFDYGIKFNVTGESVDKAQRNDAYFNALTMVLQNPAILDTPLFKQYLEDNGIPYWKLTPQQKQQLQMASTGKVPTNPIAAPKADQLSAQVDTQ